MNKPSVRLGLLIFLVLGPSWIPGFAGDSLYGKVTKVNGANAVTIDYGAGQYELRLIGIDVPKDGALAAQAARFVTGLVLGKNARMRLEGRGPGGELKVRLFTDDPALGIKEVGVELVRVGLAQRQKGFDFKYGELSAAESEARSARRGLWAADAQPR